MSLGSLPNPENRWGPYRVVREIAKGGMAVVYAVQPIARGDGSLYAVKVMRPSLAEEGGFSAMFVDEARIASAVRHPNVVRVHDVGERDGLPFIVMEYLRGMSLTRLMKRQKELGRAVPLGPALRILAETAFGLHAAHECVDPKTGEPLHIVHRDVSPQNIHIGYVGDVKVLDFGIAAAKGRLTETRTGLVKGKFGYLAPEQITREVDVDRRVDVWALGVVAWELIAGRRLFRMDDDAATFWSILHAHIPRLDDITKAPKSVADIVNDCLARDHDQRPLTCEELGRRFSGRGKSVRRDSARRRRSDAAAGGRQHCRASPIDQC